MISDHCHDDNTLPQALVVLAVFFINLFFRL